MRLVITPEESGRLDAASEEPVETLMQAERRAGRKCADEGRGAAARLLPRLGQRLVPVGERVRHVAVQHAQAVMVRFQPGQDRGVRDRRDGAALWRVQRLP